MTALTGILCFHDIYIYIVGRSVPQLMTYIYVSGREGVKKVRSELFIGLYNPSQTELPLPYILYKECQYHKQETITIRVKEQQLLLKSWYTQ